MNIKKCKIKKETNEISFIRNHYIVDDKQMVLFFSPSTLNNYSMKCFPLLISISVPVQYILLNVSYKYSRKINPSTLYILLSDLWSPLPKVIFLVIYWLWRYWSLESKLGYYRLDPELQQITSLLWDFNLSLVSLANNVYPFMAWFHFKTEALS